MACATAAAASGVATMASSAIARASSAAASASTSLAVPKSFSGLGKSFGARLASANVAVAKAASVAGVKAASQKRGVVVATASYEPLIGNVAPDFEAEAVFDQEFIKIKLSEYIGKKYVVLFFYPLDFTFVCPTEITAFSDRYSEFEKLDTEVIGVSTDSVFSHLAWIQTDRKTGGLGDLNYPIVSDITKKIAKAFNVLIPEQGIALRGLFIIDKQGVIQHATINNLGIGRSVDETLRTLQAVQYVQDNPDEVCPAGWKPGEKTMKPDSKLSKEYFEAI
ncbi:hypothetical protein M758_6G180500 [Ceratodon purpureus]|uniref:thioredoxin-dependent peroxiredoxin n=1 Tax=Ceratodon purpureus TaxID=3225 RepID=A0A8T0HIR9_CERPU|nr:hypothetical protein KC19_6G187400 [Ceratodon purpureus]KAG0614482.1 hypothetical protein M758_6G180500 [Ceratodon purpureus]